MTTPRQSVEMGPIDIHIMHTGEDLRLELTQIAREASAIANSGCKGRVKLNNLHHNEPGVKSQHLEKWKSLASFVLQDLTFDANESKLFEYSRNTHSEKTLYLHVKPAKRPVVIQQPLHLPPSIRTMSTLKNIISKEHGMKTKYTMYVLNENKQSFQLTQKEIQERLQTFPDFSPGECHLYALYLYELSCKKRT